MKHALASLWVRIWFTVSCASVGYSGTDTYPAIQMARSLISHQAQFLDRIGHPRAGLPALGLQVRCHATHLVGHLAPGKVLNHAPPHGLGQVTRLGAACSQW